MKLAKIENIQKLRKTNAVTFPNEGNEKLIVTTNFYNPCKFLTNLRILMTLKILKIFMI